MKTGFACEATDGEGREAVLVCRGDMLAQGAGSTNPEAHAIRVSSTAIAVVRLPSHTIDESLASSYTDGLCSLVIMRGPSQVARRSACLGTTSATDLEHDASLDSPFFAQIGLLTHPSRSSCPT